MNNKKIGTQWERKFCEKLAQEGYWVHFISPDARGSQPFDVIAVRNGTAHVWDCKTCVANSFNISRLEDNQILAFEKWIACGNAEPHIAVLHNNFLYEVPYLELKKSGSVKLT